MENDQIINILENTSPVIADLDCGKGENPDAGTDICMVRDKDTNGFGEDTEKPSSYILSLGELSSQLVTSDTTGKVVDKVEVGAVGGGDDGDGVYYVVVSDQSDPTKALTDNFFAGDVAQGDSFAAAGNFGSETFVHIFAAQGGAALQTINYHTSCSSPLIIGDQYGSVTLEGATLEGKDSGTIYTVGLSEVDGDAGVVYEITGGADADDFTVDADTGEVTFLTPPDFENPTDSDGDNKYDVEVTAFFVDDEGVRTGEICEVRPLEICVEDELDEICIDENTTPVVNVDLAVACPIETPRDVGLDICAARDRDVNGFGEDTDKPTAYILNLGEGLSDVIASSQDDDKVEVISTGATDDDGTFFIRVSKDDDPTKTDELFFEGDVGFGENFTASEDAFGNSFGSKTFVHIFSEDGGELLQSVEFHTSCSQPLVIGDQYGSISLAGATLVGKDTDTVYTVGGTETATEILGEGDIVYSIAGGADAAFFTIDPDTGELGFINAPDFENPQDAGGDNVYDVIVRATAINDPTCFTDKPLEVCVEDVPEVGSLSGRYFCDENRNDIEDAGDTPFADKLVTLLQGGVVVATTTTDANGDYRFDNLTPGDYVVLFEDPTTEGKAFVDPDVGTDDTVDSDVTDPSAGTTDPVTVVAGEETDNVDAGAEKLPGSISGRYFCDENDNDVDDGQAVDPGIAGVVVTAFDAAGTAVGSAVTGADGTYTIDGLEEGTYSVQFTDPDGVLEGKALVDPNVGDDDTVDSDAVGDTTLSTIADIPVTAGQDTPDNDAGAEKLPGSISGRYFCDENDNDVDDGQAVDPGIAGVVVTAFDAAGTAVGSAVTGADGTYTIDGLEEGTYSVQFTDPDGVLEGKALVDPNVGDDDTVDSDAVGDTTLSTIADIPVTAGQDTPDNDAGAEKLPGSISGRYFCDENRNDVDDGEPGVAGVTVVLTDGDGNFIAETMTESDGSYFFGNLQAGEYKVTFPEYEEDPEPPVEVDPENVQSDDFSSGELQPYWNTGNLNGATASVEVVDGNAQLCIKVPPGDFDANPNDGSNDIARLTQQIADDDFQVDVAFSSEPTERFELQGIVVEQDAENWMRFDVRSTGDGELRLFVAYVDESQPTIVLDSDIDDISEAAAMRVTRSGDDWTFETSSDGVVWIEQVSFTHAGIAPSAVGPYAGVLSDSVPGSGLDTDGYTAKVDYFFNSQDRINFEDSSLGVLSGKDFVEKDAGDDDTIDSDVDPKNGMTDVIYLAPGENKEDVDAGVKGPPLGVIGDTVWYDSFGNGLLDDFEQRASGITVQLKDGDGNVIAETVTNFSGNYLFQNLEAGEYSVGFVLPSEDFIFTDANAGDDALDSDADPVTGMTQTIILGEGEQNLTLDAGLRFCGLIEGTSQSDPNSPVGGNDLLVGCDGNDTIRGLSGEDTLFGLDGDDLIFGSFDADELFGGAGDDLLDGGSGVTRGFGSSNTDVAVYKGSLADYGLSAVDGEIFADGVVLTQTGADTFVFDTSGAGLNEGTDTLVDIEILRFDDGDFIL